MSKKETLQQSKEARVEEVAYYQHNIDNYRLALKLLDERQDPDLVDFKAQLEELLRTSLIEQKKAQTMLDVICIQLEE
jgi:hypothetical protein